jgi:4-hydroxybenzoate polyprenyltransferase
MLLSFQPNVTFLSEISGILPKFLKEDDTNIKNLQMNWLTKFGRLVKFEHTLFALPFALTGFFMAIDTSEHRLSWKLLILVVLCMVFARNAAMGFNRWLDRRIDGLNPRTAQREIPAGIISPAMALIFVIANVIFFIITTWFINKLCFFLSPVALFVILFYSYTKRISPLCHFVLSLGLAIAPVGAYLAVAGQFAWPPVLMGTIVFFWVSGFDIIYALQDEEFDKEMKLKSVPVLIGKKKALRVSEIVHGLAAIQVFSLLPIVKINIFTLSAVLVFNGLLLYQHLIVRHDDLSRVNFAFFTTNGIASVLFALLMIPGMLVT